MENYCVPNSNGVLHYINNFMTMHCDLNEVPGEGCSPSHKLLVFLDEITDPSYDTFVIIQRNKNETLDQTILALRKFDRELSAKQAEKKKVRNTMRWMIENQEISINYNDDNEFSTHSKCVKRAKRSQSDNHHVNGLNNLKYKFSSSGYLQVDPKDFKELSDKDRLFVISYNSKIRHGESTDEVKPAPAFESIMKEGSKKERPSSAEAKTPHNQNHCKRRIMFNMSNDNKSDSEE
eukprot:12767073-Ditylum_brightwellii.AAC.1